MQRSYIVKSPVNFVNFGFFVRIGDVLVHDTANSNKLVAYRGGEIVKVITHTSLGMAALLKQGFIIELTPTIPTKVAVKKEPEKKEKEEVLRIEKETLQMKTLNKAVEESLKKKK